MMRYMRPMGSPFLRASYMPATSTAPVLLSDLRVGATARFHDAKLDTDMSRFLRAIEGALRG